MTLNKFVEKKTKTLIYKVWFYKSLNITWLCEVISRHNTISNWRLPLFTEIFFLVFIYLFKKKHFGVIALKSQNNLSAFFNSGGLKEHVTFAPVLGSVFRL